MLTKKKVVFLNILSERKSVWDTLSIHSYGVLILASILRDSGYYDVSIYDEKKIPYEEVIKADFICFSFYTCASDLAYEISDKIHGACTSKSKVPIRIMGGIHPSYCAEEVLNHCEYVIRGEGEISLPALLRELQKENPNLRGITGLSYKDKSPATIHNEQAEMVEDKNLLEAMPAHDLGPNRHLLTRTPILTPSRGCPYSCNFCSQPFGKKVKLADPGWVVSEFKRVVVKKYYNLSKVLLIGSDNFAANRKWAKDILNLALKRNLLGKICLHIQCRTDIARDEEMLHLLSLFVTRAYIGVESFDEKTLSKMNKGVTAEKMMKDLKVIIGAGIPIHSHLIIGTDYDTPDTVQNNIKIAREIGIHGISLFCTNPFPGTPYRDEMVRQNRIITSDWCRYDLQHVVIAPLLGLPSHFQTAIQQGYKDFYSIPNAFMYFRKMGVVAGIFGLMMCRGFRKHNSNIRKYTKFLEEWEKDRYTKDGILKHTAVEESAVELAV